MRQWVKRRIEWTQEAQTDIGLLQASGNADLAAAAKAAMESYATTGAAHPHFVAYFEFGKWRGIWRLKQIGQRGGFRVLFEDYSARRLIIVNRVRLRADAYDDPPG